MQQPSDSSSDECNCIPCQTFALSLRNNSRRGPLTRSRRKRKRDASPSRSQALISYPKPRPKFGCRKRRKFERRPNSRSSSSETPVAKKPQLPSNRTSRSNRTSYPSPSNSKVDSHLRKKHPVGGLTRLEINSLPSNKMTKDANEKCIICLDRIKKGQIIKRVPCMHFFHSDCLDTWLHEKAVCPLCFTEINLEKTYYY